MLKGLREKYWKRVSFLFVANEARLMLRPTSQLILKVLFLPQPALTKLELYPHGSGGLSDVWKCSMSTPSETRIVSLQTGRRPIVYQYLGCCQIHPDAHRKQQRNVPGGYS